MRHAIHRDLMFLHGFEWGSLRFGCGTVNFVGKDDLTHDWTRAELEFALLLIENGNARYIAGEHIWRELNTIERAVQRLGKAACQHRLADAGHVFDQNMSLT